ncbi:Cytochrome c, mono-and diheme variants [Solimonas aquatica]|uniref:Cytochrome c, mono-and diheme variants n=1 Tax=Solimonas aquatica TaxID=489703 RepID=A0A1H9FUT4_9GAMM|nr:cytochrome c [Solimonas aquatica]SEQ41626.1 Cytochrome c, mono-and diheme variants [Solimonas aquatica]
MLKFNKHHAPWLAAALLAVVSLGAQAQADLRSGTIFSSGMKFEEKDGESLYRGICQGCHMPDAKGAQGAGAYPALADDPRLAAKAYPAIMVLKGSRAMPSFAMGLDDAQVAAVVNYVRSHFGNSYRDTLSAAEVKALRK